MLMKIDLEENFNKQYWEDCTWLVSLDGTTFNITTGQATAYYARKELSRRQRELTSEGIQHRVSLTGNIGFADQKTATFYALKWSDFRIK